MRRKLLGNLGEKLAQDFLHKAGYQLLETNYRCREGEIDVIAQKGDWLVFVEVRTRKSDAFGSPEESITSAKKERLSTAALHYLATHTHLPSLWRLDVIVVEMDKEGKVSRLEHIEDAIC